MSGEQYFPTIVAALKASPYYKFTDSGTYLTKGVCPQCGDKSLYISKSKPLVLDCNHKNRCGFSESVRDAMPELFEDFAKKYPATKENQQATASAYLGMNRGFDLSKIRGWYEQGKYALDGERYLPTVRFYLDIHKTRYWERIIGKGRDGQKAHFGGKRKDDNSLFKGDVWAPPKFKLDKFEECYIVEGIFHAIALYHVGVKAVAAFSCNHFPQAFFEQHAKKCVKWVWALDSDKAGKDGMRKHHKALRAMGELSAVCLVPAGKDWDDLYREGMITPTFLSNCKHNGRLFLAESVEEKAYFYFLKNYRSAFILDFENALFDIKLGSDFLEQLAAMTEDYRDKRLADETKTRKKSEYSTG